MPDNPAETSAPPAITQGELLAGKYRVERVLGSGGMGVVVAARHEELDQLVAVKLLRPDMAQTEIAVARFQREARAAARIQSDHVARVFDVGTLGDGRVYMVMEHLSGVDLADLVAQRGALPIADAIGYALEALEAVAHAHAQGIVHRDLKPSNLFLATRPDGSKRIKVLDFGISKSSSPLSRPAAGPALTTADAILGSPGYMSPEQVKSSKDVDGRSDIWSMGVILYELLTGTQPFAAETIGAVLANILEGPPEPVRKRRADVPEELERAVMRCMARDKEARFASAADLATALAPFATDAAKTMTERISLVLGRLSEPPSSEPRGMRISSGDGKVVSQTAATFEAPAPFAAESKGSADAEAPAAKNASTVSLAAGTWSGKAERPDGSRRKIAAWAAIACCIGLVAFFAWRIAATPAGRASEDHAPTGIAVGTATIAPAATAAPGSAAPVPVVAPSEDIDITPRPGTTEAPSASATTTAGAAKPAAAIAGQPSQAAASSRKTASTPAVTPSKAPGTKSIPTALLRDRD